jgi:hypothetical protein
VDGSESSHFLVHAYLIEASNVLFQEVPKAAIEVSTSKLRFIAAFGSTGIIRAMIVDGSDRCEFGTRQCEWSRRLAMN